MANWPTRRRRESPRGAATRWGGVDADYGEVGGGIVADGVRGETAAIGERDFDSRGVVDDVAVGENQAVGGEDES